MTNLHQTLVVTATAYSDATGLPLHKIARRIGGNQYLFLRLAAGGSLTCTNWEKAMQWLSDNWPERRAWPKGVTRPGKSV